MSKQEKTKSLISDQYKRKSLFVESWLRIRTNPGAVFGLVIIIIIILMMFYSIFFISFRDVTRFVGPRLQPPSSQYWFGLDEMGRDLFLRMVYGSRYSLAVGFGSVGFGLIVGTFFGAIAGFFGPTVENIIMRIADVLSSIPAILLGMVIVAVLGPSLMNLILAIAISNVSGFVRMGRAAILAQAGDEYVESSKAIGMSEFRTLFTQVLPNSISPLIVTATMRMGTAVLSAAGLSFLGFGVPVPHPEWGAIINGGRQYMLVAPHVTFYPGIFIMAITFGCALLGDGLRDALDPRLKK